MHPPQILRRFRFRTSTLLWLVALVAAFFLGRQSDEIAVRLAQLRQSLRPGSASYVQVTQQDGSLLIVSKPKLNGLTAGARHNDGVARATLLDRNRAKIEPRSDGNTQIVLWQYDAATSAYNFVTLDVVVKNHRVTATPSVKPTIPSSHVLPMNDLR